MPSVPRASGSNSPPWPDEPASPPARSSRKPGAGDRLPAGWEIVRVTGAPLHGATFAASFVRAIARDPAGKEHTVILRRLTPDSPGSIIWEGDIQIRGRYAAFRITPGRALKSPDWSDFLTVESIDRMGISSGQIPIAAMDLVQTKPKAFWPDQLKVTLTGRVSHIAEFIRMSGAEWGSPSTLMIRGQGPVYLRDGSPIPNALLDHSLVFVSRSRVFDTRGETRNVMADLSQIPETFAYYDLTPEAEITREETARGCERFRDAYGECPNFPMIPAAFLGQLFTGFAATVKPQYFTAILQVGIKGSGKTQYAARWDAVQARYAERTRNTVRHPITPVLNLGDKTGTVKGPKYRMADFGGYSITVDDVLKEGDSPALQTTQSDAVSNLIRSFESGGAALAGVDYARNEVGGRESPSLHSSIRVLSEIPTVKDSTQDRMLVMPAIGEPWGRGNVFSIETASRLSTPEAVEDMHRAYSAYVAWAFQRLDSDMEETYNKARAETDTWEVDSRYAARYAAAVAGHFMFGRFAETIGVDISAQVRAAVDALRECARAQACTSVPLSERFASDIRLAIRRGRIAFPGRPQVDADGIASTYGLPWIMGETITDNGTERRKRVMPDGITLADIGMRMLADGKPVINDRAIVGGYSLPPRSEDTPGRKGHALTRIWRVACKPGQFTDVCRIVSEISGRAYDPSAVIDALRSDKHGDNARERITGEQERVKIFALIWALRSREDD